MARSPRMGQAHFFAFLGFSKRMCCAGKQRAASPHLSARLSPPGALLRHSRQGGLSSEAAPAPGWVRDWEPQGPQRGSKRKSPAPLLPVLPPFLAADPQPTWSHPWPLPQPQIRVQQGGPMWQEAAGGAERSPVPRRSVQEGPGASAQAEVSAGLFPKALCGEQCPTPTGAGPL